MAQTDRLTTGRKKTNNKPDSAVEEINVPPHSLEAEQAVLGGILLNNEHWESITDQVVAEDFYNHAHRLIFQAIEELFRHNHPPAITV